MARNPEFDRILFRLSKIRKEIKYKKSVVVTSDFLEKLDTIFVTQYGTNGYDVKYICKLRDETCEEYTSYLDLARCDNALERSIEQLKIYATSREDKELSFHATIGLGGSDTFGNYTIAGEINSNEESIDSFEEEINYQIRKITRSKFYNCMSRAGIIPTLFFAIIFSLLFYHFLGLPPDFVLPPFINIQYNTTAFWDRVAQYANVGFMGLGESIIFLQAVKKLFPRAVFLFGNGANNETRKAELRSHILWSIIIALFINVVGAFVYSNLFAIS